MLLRKLSLLSALLLLPGLALAVPTRTEMPLIRKPIVKVDDPDAFARQLRARGYKRKGGIEKARTERDDDDRSRSFPHFNGSFSFGGQTFPYTMVGYPPKSGRTANLKSVIIPIRPIYVFFADEPIVFEPGKAVDNILKSPMFNDARFINGTGQFGDQLQRATFWNKMDREHNWHVKMDRPRVAKTVDVLVEPDIGDLFLVRNQLIGDIFFGALDSTIHTILQYADVQPDEVPIFVTYNVSADFALGYHDAFVVGRAGGQDVLQTLIYTSWLEESAVGPLLADISTLNHEVAEWLNDPYVNNESPNWLFPPFNRVCSDIPFVEVGDPQGNGPDYRLFPTVPIRLNGFTYHLQDIVMLPWFTGEVPSSAQNGWYDFPDTTQITTPMTPCR